jgi:hypothetical protein
LGSYYDADYFGSTYYSLYINDFVYQSLKYMAELETGMATHEAPSPAASLREQAKGWLASAQVIKNGINTVLWDPNSPNGPMYIDWINNDNGIQYEVFTAAGQYNAITFGIADHEQAVAILATADARLAVLPAINGYNGSCTPVNLWTTDTTTDPYPFGTMYGNGACLLMETYYEIMARVTVGDVTDVAAAYSRLQKYAADYQQTSFWGDNWMYPDGLQGYFLGYEWFLADQVLTSAVLVRGLLGVNQTWNGLTVTPHLPASWKYASASVLYKGAVVCVNEAVNNGVTTVTQHGGRC